MVPAAAVPLKSSLVCVSLINATASSVSPVSPALNSMSLAVMPGLREAVLVMVSVGLTAPFVMVEAVEIVFNPTMVKSLVLLAAAGATVNAEVLAVT